MADTEIELTELTDLEVIRQDAVGTPASGFPFLIMKSVAKDVNAVGGIDEKPDIAGADTVLSQLYKLIESEAREGAVGAHEECDIHILAEAVSLIRCFRENEVWADQDDGEMCKSADGLVFKAHRKFSSDERRSLASEGKALSDGSYPIPDADALRRAAILARSGHGDVGAAKRLIARRAKELGVPNPLAEHEPTQKDSTLDDKTPEVTEPQTGEVPEAVAKMIEDAKAEAIKTAEERTRALADELAVLKATPVPGAIALTNPAGDSDPRIRSNSLQKAAYHRRQLDVVQDRDLIAYHKDQLAKAEAAAGL